MKRLSSLAASFLLVAAVPASAATTDADATIRQIAAEPSYRAAAAALDSGHDRWVEDIVAITQIAAPPFKEEDRA
jgi:hypothetical protein